MRVSIFIAYGLKEKCSRVKFEQVSVGKAGIDVAARCGGLPVQAGGDLRNTPGERSVHAPTAIHYSAALN